jgi:cobalt-zinc-cadmium efflux system membrane fusion protein
MSCHVLTLPALRSRPLERTRRSTRNGLLYALCSCALFGIACGGEKKANPATETAATPQPEVKGNAIFIPQGSPLRDRLVVAPVTSQLVQSRLIAPAQVEAEPTRMAKISPPLPGRIVKLYVRFGEAVKVGQPLFGLDAPDLVAAQSDYLKAKSALSQAERNVARQKDLLDHGIGAQRDYEQASTDRDTAQSELERTATRLQLLGIRPGMVGGTLTVTAPITGRVIDLSTAPGQYQNDPASVLMIVADLSTVWVTASVQEKDIRKVSQGEEATASFAAYPDETFTGNVLFVGDLLDPDTRTIKVRVAFPNDASRLKPGMFATVAFKSRALPELVVPTHAVVLNGEQSSVFVETAPWTFTRSPVELGEQLTDSVVVTKGIESGVRIVTSNAVLLP